MRQRQQRRRSPRGGSATWYLQIAPGLPGETVKRSSACNNRGFPRQAGGYMITPPRERLPRFAMLFKMARRVLFETDKRLLWKLAWNMGVKGALSVERHKRRLKRGEVFPPFLYVSVINSCNLRCQGCW